MTFHKPTFARDTVFAVLGVLGLGYATVRGGVDPALIVAFVGMLGLPVFLRTDEARKKKDAQAAAPDPVQPPVPVPGPGVAP